MSGFNNPHTPKSPSVREASIKLLADLDRIEGAPRLGSIEALRQALQSEASIKPGANEELIVQLELVRTAMAAANPGSTTAEVCASAIEALRANDLSFTARWEADMRATRRWQAGDRLPMSVRNLLERAGVEARAAASHYADTGLGDGYRDASQLATEIEQELKLEDPGGRALIWPDHTDMLIWLLEERGDPLEPAREAFLNLIADADRFDEDMDGDIDSEGRTTMSIDYDLRVGHSQLEELVDALALPPARFMETVKDRIDRAISQDAATGCADDQSALGDAVGVLIEPGQAGRDMAEAQGLPEPHLVRTRPAERQPVPGIHESMGELILTDADRLPPGHCGTEGDEEDRPQAPFGGHTRSSLTRAINDKLATMVEPVPGAGIEVAACVNDMAPGWEFVELDTLDGTKAIELTRYAPDEPI